MTFSNVPPSTLADWISRIAERPSGLCLAAVEAEHLKRQLTYSELNMKADLFAQNLLVKLVTLDDSPLPHGTPRPVCLHMHRTVDWYIAYVGCSRAGVALVCHSRDLLDKKIENARMSAIQSLLSPILVITDDSFSSFMTPAPEPLSNTRERSSVMAYHFTGGSTSESKCVKITESMVVHELVSYPLILTGLTNPKKVLQNSSTYWPASAFGQLDIAIAFNACAVLSDGKIEKSVSDHEIDCIGMVPSVLRSLEAISSLKTIFTWGEPLPMDIALKWCTRVQLIDLLIATEYWLSLYSVVTTPENGLEYKLVPNVNFQIKDQILFIAGDMVTPGYVGQSDRFHTLEGKVFFCTNDSVMQTRNNQIKYIGRSDDLVKIGGKFVHLKEAEALIKECVGEFVLECVVLKRGSIIHVAFNLSKIVNIPFIIQIVKKTLPTVESKNVHFVSQIPRNPVTGKIDHTALLAMVDPPWTDPQYTEKDIPENAKFSIPNPNRWIWLILVFLFFSFDIKIIIKIVEQLISSGVQCDETLKKLILFPFVSAGICILEKYRFLKKIIYEFPGGQFFFTIFILMFWKLIWIIDQLIVTIGIIGILSLTRENAKISDQMVLKNALFWSFFHLIVLCFFSFALPLVLMWRPKTIASWMWIFYMTLPSKLGWAWQDWWKTVDSYSMLLPYYFSKFDVWLKRVSIVRGPIVDLIQFWKTCWTPTIGFITAEQKKHVPRTKCTRCVQMSNSGSLDKKGFWVCETCWWMQIGWFGSNKGDAIEETRDGKADNKEYNISLKESEIFQKSRLILDSFGIVDSSDLNIFTSISSLLKISIFEKLQQQFAILGKKCSAMLFFKDISSFSDFFLQIDRIIVSVDSSDNHLSVVKPYYKINNCSPALWENGACDWLLKIRPPNGLKNPEQNVKNIIAKLVERHLSMRAFPLDDLRRTDYLQEAIGQIAGVPLLKKLTMKAAKELWPRICVTTPPKETPVKFIYPETFSEKSILSLVSCHRGESVFVPPVEFLVFLPFTDSDDVVETIYIYFRITHLFADGYCASTIASDLDMLFTDPLRELQVANGFEVLEKRLFSNFNLEKSLYGSNLATHGEEIGSREATLVKVVWLQKSVVMNLASFSRQIGIPTEILIMGIVAFSLGQKMNWNRIPITLMHAMRDGMNETNMIGYFAEYKELGFFPCNFLQLLHALNVKIRDRNWRTYSQNLYDHCIGQHRWDGDMFPISFNVLPHMRNGVCVESVDTYWRASPRNNMKDCRLIHVYIEETKLDSEWGIRFHFNKKMFDCDWILDYVTNFLENSISLDVLGRASK